MISCVFLDKKRRKKILEAELRRILNILQTLDIEKIILFGSLLRNDIMSTSDIDLIIIKETKKRFLDRLDEIYTTIKPRVAMDILVYTPKEFEKLQKESSFIRQILKEGKVLYEKKF
ncbi:MAG: nucleotidyltransferase domain-containing protein [bacterium]|nr:nucleotidyltransferase domain-containing protein [bacterium]